MDPLFDATAVARIIIAGGLGSLIGIERTMRGKDAGIRTSSMIAIGSCLFTLLSIASGGEPSRIAAGIVTGVGFLGAGVLLKTDRSVLGLTTAANIWLVAAIGMAVGMGQVELASFVTLFAILVLIAFKPVGRYFRSIGKIVLTQYKNKEEEID